MTDTVKGNKTDQSLYFNVDHLQTDLKRRAARGAGATVVGQVCGFAIYTFGTLVLARLVTPDDFGLVAIVMAYSLLLQNFGPNAFTQLVIQEPGLTHRHASTLFWIANGLSLMLTISFIVLSPLIALFYSDTRLLGVGLLISFCIFGAGLSTFHTALLMRGMRFIRTSLNDVATRLVSTVVAIALGFLGWGFWAIVIRQIVYTTTNTIGAWILCRWVPGKPGKIGEVRPMLKFAFANYGNYCVIHFSRNIDRMVMGKVLGPEPLGYYDRGTNLCDMLPGLLSSPLNGVAVATLSKLREDPEQFRHYLRKMIELLAFIFMPVSAILTVLGSDIALVLLGPQWGMAGKILTVLAPSMGMTVLYNMNGALHLSLGRVDRFLRWTFFGMGCSVLIVIMGLPFGPLGVAAGFSAFYYLMVGPALAYAGLPVKTNIGFYLHAIWRYWAAAAVTGSICWTLCNEFEPLGQFVRGLHPLLRIGALTGCLLFMYVLVVAVLYRSMAPVLQLLKTLREMTPKSEKH